VLSNLTRHSLTAVSLEREREKGVERATVSTESESRGWLASKQQRLY
jgi:hypothetical protein